MPVASLVKNSDDATLTLMAVVLFDPDNAFLGAANIGKVDEIGEKMAANPAMRIVIRGYAAPFGTEYGQLRVSEIRARVTMDYLMSMHDVSSARIVLEWVGAAEMPKNARIGVYEQYRAVDVFIR
jgi:outer membrane protein OmpA-like peptidoglycan-associated protein